MQQERRILTSVDSSDFFSFLESFALTSLTFFSALSFLPKIFAKKPGLGDLLPSVVAVVVVAAWEEVSTG